jgi:hypothetical protein
MASKKAAIGEATKEYRRDLYAIAIERHAERIVNAARTAKRLRTMRDVFANEPITRRTMRPFLSRIEHAIEVDGERDEDGSHAACMNIRLGHAIPTASGYALASSYWDDEATSDDDRWAFLVAAIAHEDTIRESPAPTFAAIVKHDDARIAALRGA